MRPRRPFPANDLTVVLYFQSLMDNAYSFSTIKSASASIAFFHKNKFIDYLSHYGSGSVHGEDHGRTKVRPIG